MWYDLEACDDKLRVVLIQYVYMAINSAHDPCPVL